MVSVATTDLGSILLERHIIILVASVLVLILIVHILIIVLVVDVVLVVLPVILLLCSRCLGIAELQSPYVILVKPVALECVNDHCRLQRVLKVRKTEQDLTLWPLVSRDQSHRLEPSERSENV